MVHALTTVRGARWGAATLGIFIVAAGAGAQLVPAWGGYGGGVIQHASSTEGPATPGLPTFELDGAMSSVGGGQFPSLTVRDVPFNQWTFGFVPNVVQSRVTPLAGPGSLPAPFGSARTDMMGIAGINRAGVAATWYELHDLAAGDGSVSTNIFYGIIEYNAVVPIFGARFGHFLAVDVTAGPVSHAQAGVITRIDIGLGSGPGFVSQFTWFAPPIYMAWDGPGGRADIFEPANVIFNVGGNPQRVRWRGVAAYPPLNIPAGFTVRIQGTVTLISDDPNSIMFDAAPPAFADQFEYGTGAATNADDLLERPAGPDCFTRGIPGPVGACPPSLSYIRPTTQGHFVTGGPDGRSDGAQCKVDWNGDGCRTPADVATFVTSWFFSANNPGNLDGDYNCDGSVVPVDLASFVAEWFDSITNPATYGC